MRMEYTYRHTLSRGALWCVRTVLVCQTGRDDWYKTWVSVGHGKWLPAIENITDPDVAAEGHRRVVRSLAVLLGDYPVLPDQGSRKNIGYGSPAYDHPRAIDTAELP